MKSIHASSLADLVLRIDKASADHTITPGEAETVAKRAKLVLLRSGDKAAAARAALEQLERVASLRVNTVSGPARDTLERTLSELSRVRRLLGA